MLHTSKQQKQCYLLVVFREREHISLDLTQGRWRERNLEN